MLQAAKDVFLTLTPGGSIIENRNRVSYFKLSIKKLVGEEKTCAKIKKSADVILARFKSKCAAREQKK